MDLRGRDFPSFEMRTDTEADVELRALRREVLNRLHVQMIVVIVRDQHGVDPREIRERDRRRVHALRSDRHRRDAVGQHRICHDPHAFDLHQHARMTEPYRAQAICGRRTAALPATAPSPEFRTEARGSDPGGTTAGFPRASRPSSAAGVFWNRPSMNSGDFCMRSSRWPSKRRRRPGAGRCRSQRARGRRRCRAGSWRISSPHQPSIVRAITVWLPNNSWQSAGASRAAASIR